MLLKTAKLTLTSSSNLIKPIDLKPVLKLKSLLLMIRSSGSLVDLQFGGYDDIPN